MQAPKPVKLDPPATRETASLAVAEGAAPDVQTIIYIHGIANKPPASVLKCQWDSALFGVQLGDRSRMAYWVNRQYYPQPLSETCASGDVVRIDDDEVSTKAIMALAAARPTNEQDAIDAEIQSLTDDPVRREWLSSLTNRMLEQAHLDESTVPVAGVQAAGGVSAKVLPLPPFLRRLITQKISRAFLRDVNDFFFHANRRQVMEQSLLDRLNAGGGPFVVIAHSQGSMIAYNVLRQLAKQNCDVRLFVTIGSPLGMAEVQDVLRQWVGRRRLPFPPCVTRWVNVADRLDPVAIDNNISNDFEGTIENHSGFMLNPDSPRDPHSGTGYLRTNEVRRAVRETVGNAFAQATGQMVVTKDLVDNLEDSYRQDRHQVLVQLTAPESGGLGGDASLGSIRDALKSDIETMVRGSGDSVEDAGIELLKHYVAARLTRLEIESLRTKFADLKIERVWRDAAKRALIYQSTNTVQARPANLGYSALGRGINWAVLDTGIRADHPHFKDYANIKGQWDCTRPGPPVKRDGAASTEFDGNGHGTHVAGIIAGHCQVPLKKGVPPEIFAGMAPEASLYDFKVLDDQGRGQDSWIIKALDTIADLNEQAGRLIIHGVNVSLGGSFDPSVYNVGHTPLCQEMRRLWRQGVLVCLAAGNEGYAMLRSLDGELPANLDLTIGDPANLEEAIAVGSVHKTNPHTYGISYFSSRGPTADGRQKPDLVAPGEQILSTYNKFNADKAPQDWVASDLYVEMSGTSMATPHVSGILAAFLSQRREFIGYPERVKAILLDNCTDLSRDSYFQGRGLPNLIKMLANS